MSTLTPRRSAEPATPSRVGPLGRLARITFRRRGRTVLAWLGVLVAAVLLNQSVRFQGIFRGIVLIPWVVPGSLAAMYVSQSAA